VTPSGRQGEDRAVVFLSSRGYRILERNFRVRFGEIDIIADDHGTLCFVEVKSRSHSRFGWPVEAVDTGKQKKIAKAAAYYLQQKGLYGSVACRFDVVSLLPDEPPTLYQDAFRL
jgi:putative endonuclease